MVSRVGQVLGLLMNVSDVEAGVVNGPAIYRRAIMEGSIASEGYLVNRVELRCYSMVPPKRSDAHEGPESGADYFLLTAFVETDKGTVEMKYLEGRGGQELFDNAFNFLQQYSGVSSLVNRAVIELIGASKDQKSG